MAPKSYSVPVLQSAATPKAPTPRSRRQILRVDQPIAKKAIAISSPIIVAATPASILGSTSDLIRDALAKAGKVAGLIE